MDTERPLTDPRDGRPPSSDSEVVFYHAPPPADARLEVRLKRDTLWLTQKQMGRLFRTSASNVSRHLGNVFDEGELDPSATTEDFSMVRSEGDRQVRRTLTRYNLDAIISVGYRVDSKRAGPFRRWADRLLRNRWRAAAIAEAVWERTTLYAETFRLLLEYDEDRLEIPLSPRPASAILDDQAVAAITTLKTALIERGEASPLFGNASYDGLERILDDLIRTRSDDPIHQPREEKAANLLYSVIRDRPFAEGSKRISALLFLLYLRQESRYHYLSPRALTALTLLVARSVPAEKKLVIRLIVNLLAAPTP